MFNLMDLNSLGFQKFLGFFNRILLKLFYFIRDNEIVFYSFMIPVFLTCLFIILDFVFDLSHLLDNFKPQNTLAYKGYSRYQKQQAEQRKREEIERKKAEKKAYEAEHPFKHTRTVYQNKDGKWVEKNTYTYRDDKQPGKSNGKWFNNMPKKYRYSDIEKYYYESPKKDKPKKNIDIYVED